MIFDTLLQLFTMKQLKMIVKNRRGLPGRLGKMLAAMEEEE